MRLRPISILVEGTRGWGGNEAGWMKKDKHLDREDAEMAKNVAGKMRQISI